MEGELVHNPKFQNLQKPENAELRFFCEALSLVDAVSGSNLLLGFSTQVRESKDGKVKWGDIPDLFPEGAKSPNYLSGIKRVGDLVDQVVRKGWVTPLRTKSLATMALEAHNHHKRAQVNVNSSSAEGDNKYRMKRSPAVVAQAWKDMANQMDQLAKFQDEHMSYHADFQKTNYLPHPDSWKVYLGTVTFIFTSILCSFLFF